MDNDQKALIARFQHILDKEGLSRVKLAERLGYTRQGLDRIFKQNGKPAFPLMLSLRETLGVDLNWLVTGEGDPYKEMPTMEKPVDEEKIKETYDLKLKLAKKDLEMCQMEVRYLKQLLDREE